PRRAHARAVAAAHVVLPTPPLPVKRRMRGTDAGVGGRRCMGVSEAWFLTRSVSTCSLPAVSHPSSDEEATAVDPVRPGPEAGGPSSAPTPLAEPIVRPRSAEARRDHLEGVMKLALLCWAVQAT